MKNDEYVEMYHAIGNSMTQNDMNAEMYQMIGNSMTYLWDDLVIKNLAWKYRDFARPVHKQIDMNMTIVTIDH